MIVSEQQAQIFFDYLIQQPHPLSVYQFKLMRAENEARELRAKLYRASNQETVAAKDAEVQCNSEYQSALLKVDKLSYWVEEHKSRKYSAIKGLDIWEQEGHNARAAERVR